MAVFFSTLDMILASVLVFGSPGIGYVILRCVVVSSRYWEGWKRLAGASIIGMGWAFTVFWILSPLTQTNVKMETLVDYFAYAGMGLFALTTIASLANRLVIGPVLASYFPRAVIADPTPVTRERMRNVIYKPSQLRANPAQYVPLLKEPTLENDVLSMLKEENFQGKTTKTKRASRDEGDLLADEPEEGTPVRKRSPMQDMGEFEGFEETLAQLKRDLKDFNENVAQPVKRKRKT